MKLKKILSVLAAGVMSAVYISANIPVSADEETNNIVIIGDSIATGYNLEGYDNNPDSGDGSFGSMLWAGSTGYVNLAEDGTTSDELLDSMENRKIEDALKKADTAVVSVGGNDLLQPLLGPLNKLTDMQPEAIDSMLKDEFMVNKMIESVTKDVNGVDIKAVGDNINGVLQTIHEYNPDTEVYIFTVYNAFEPLGDKYPGLSPLSELAEEKLSELNDCIKTAAENNDAKVADLYSSFIGYAEQYTNINDFDIHPNKEGHIAIYDELIRAGINQVNFRDEKFEWFRNLRFAEKKAYSVDSSKVIAGEDDVNMYEISSITMAEKDKYKEVHAFVYSSELLEEAEFKIVLTAYTKDGKEICTFDKESFSMNADGSDYGAAAVSALPSAFIEDTDFKIKDIDHYTLYLAGDYDNGKAFTFGLEIFNTFLLGDANGNGKVDIYDAIAIAKSVIKAIVFNADEKKAADYNGDGKVNLYDAIGIARYILSGK